MIHLQCIPRIMSEGRFCSNQYDDFFVVRDRVRLAVHNLEPFLPHRPRHLRFGIISVVVNREGHSR